MDQQRLDEYQGRVSEWIGKQGILFQLRHTGTLGTTLIIKQLVGLFVRLLLLFAVLGAVGYFFANRYLSSSSYGEKIEAQIGSVLDTKAIKSKGFNRSRGTGGFRDLSMEGGDRSFFFNATIEDLNAPFEFLTGLTSEWAPDELRLASGDFELKSGGDDGEMDHAFAGVIKTLDGKSIKSVDIADASFDWGYSKLTYGRIEGTKFEARLVDQQWEISLAGGTFQQNWIRDFSIKSAKLLVDKEGVTVRELVLQSGGGTLELSGAIEGPVSKPQFDLKGSFRSLPITQVIRIGDIKISNYLHGQISGDLRITGSTDKKIRMKGDIDLEEGDVIILREKWAILKGLSLIDVNRTYRRVDFEDGTLSFESYNGGLTFEKIDLRAGELAKLKGEIIARLPSQQEAADRLGITLTDGFSGNGFRLDATDSNSAQAMEDERMSLRRATGGGSRVDDLNLGESGVAQRANQATFGAESLDQKRLRQEMNVHLLTGSLKLGVPAAAFSENGKLSALYPADGAGWRWVDLKFNGEETFTTLTNTAKMKLLADSRERKYGEQSEDSE